MCRLILTRSILAEVEATQESIDGWMDKQNVVYTYHGACIQS